MQGPHFENYDFYLGSIVTRLQAGQYDTAFPAGTRDYKVNTKFSINVHIFYTSLILHIMHTEMPEL
jgi:hypothetical protein